MKQGGWSFKDFLFILVIIFVALFILIILVRSGIESISKTNNQKTNKNQEIVETKNTYNNLESRIKIAAQKYQNDNYQTTLDSTETIVLKYKMLRKSGYLSQKIVDIQNKKTECDGYVIFYKKGAWISYTPYIKCGKNYQTDGFDQTLVE